MIGAQLERIARVAPDDTAVVFGERRFSYADLNDRACRLANALSATGVRKGDRVAGLMHNCHQFIEVFFASAMLGARFVPVNFRLAPPEIERILRSCTPRALVFGEEFRDALAPVARSGRLPGDLVEIRSTASGAEAWKGAVDYESSMSRFPPQAPDVAISLLDDQLIVFSSGTTGEPKGAVWTHGTTLLSATAKIIDFRLTRDDVTVVFGPLYHVGPLMDLAIPVLLRGGTLVIGPSRRFDPVHLLDTLETERATVVTIYPTMWRQLLAVTDLPARELGSVRALFTGGEPISKPLLGEIYRRFPDTDFINTYGGTEAGPITTFLPADRRFEKAGSIGVPAFGVEVRLVDGQGRDVVPGTVGEVIVRSPFVCKGYWNRPEATQAALREGWWHTGDLAWRDTDGLLWIAGRKKDVIISGAENIYPVEVEQVIANLDGVSEVAVVGIPDERWGEAVVAAVVCERGVELDAATIIDHCAPRLASYKKPRRVMFVESLPRPTGNKVSKAALREQAVMAFA